MIGSERNGSHQIGLTERQWERFEAIRDECKQADPDLPAPTDEQLFSSLLDTWDAVGEGFYSGRSGLPEVVCLCGSTRFKDEYRAENARLSLDGKIVLSVGFFHHSDEKANLDGLHFRKIDLADRVHVINVDGYVGDSTKGEIRHAINTGTPVSWYDPENIPAGFELIDRYQGTVSDRDDVPSIGGGGN